MNEEKFHIYEHPCLQGCGHSNLLLNFGDFSYRIRGCGGPYGPARQEIPLNVLTARERHRLQAELATRAALGVIPRPDVETFLDRLFQTA